MAEVASFEIDERAANGDGAKDAYADITLALARWTETIQRLSLASRRIALVSQIAAEVQRLG